MQCLFSVSIEADVLSYGHPGAKSRQIYRDLTVNENILSDDGVYYVVIVAGVNDTAGHIGRDFYVHHMMNIVYELNNHKKIPVILELPEFDVAALPDIPSTVKAFAYRLILMAGKLIISKTTGMRSTLKLLIPPQSTSISPFLLSCPIILKIQVYIATHGISQKKGMPF